MKIELRNIKHSAFASQETHCYQATIYVDGKKVGDVSNHGHGGSDNIYIKDRELLKKMENSPEVKKAGGHLEYLFGELVNDFLEVREMKRKCKKSTCYNLKGDPKGEYWVMKNQPFDLRVKNHLQTKHGDKLVEIINERFVTV